MTLPAAMQRLIAAAIPPLPLDEARIRETVSRATHGAGSTETRNADRGAEGFKSPVVLQCGVGTGAASDPTKAEPAGNAGRDSRRDGTSFGRDVPDHRCGGMTAQSDRCIALRAVAKKTVCDGSSRSGSSSSASPPARTCAPRACQSRSIVVA